MDRFLSDTDIADFLDETGAPNIQIYEQITKYKHAKQLFQNNNKTYEYAVIFLPVQSKSVGHWQLVIKTEKAYYFFDSYGEMPNTKVDKYLGTSANLQRILQQERDRELIINNAQYQKYSSDIGTCGRWCLFCLYIFHTYSDADFNLLLDIVLYLMKRFKFNSPDKLVTALVNKTLETPL